ncbi:MAG: hypothetical protein ACFFA1_04830 [Promethearchaeota archaeon]
MLLITTSHRPARRTRTLCNDLTRVIPDALRINRGKMSIHELALKTIESDAKIAIIVSTLRGNPSKISFLSVTPKGFNFTPPTLQIGKVVLRREIIKRRAPDRPKLIITHDSQTITGVEKLAGHLANHLNSPIYPGKPGPKLAARANIALYIDESHSYPAVLKFIEIPTMQELGPTVYIRKINDVKEED